MRRFQIWVALVLFPVICSADVIVVPDDYGTIQLAVDATSDGDTILVNPVMEYEEFVIDNKDLRVVSMFPDVQVPIDSEVTVVNLAPGKTVVFSGLLLDVFISDPALVLVDCQGSIRVEDCDCFGGDGIFSMYTPDHGEPGATIANCDDVAFLRCTMMGGIGGMEFYSGPGDGGAGLLVEASAVALYDCMLTGGMGGSGDWSGGKGGHACAASNASTIFVSGSEFQGGEGGWEAGYYQYHGGDGLNFSDADSIARSLDCSFQGGESGGMPVDGSGTLHYINETARTFDMPSPVGEGQNISINFEGEPSDLVGMLMSAMPASQFMNNLNGQLLVSPAPLPVILYFGTAPTGSLSFSFDVPEQGPGIEAVTLYAQSFFITSSGSKILGSQRSLVVLDEAFVTPPDTIQVPYDYATIQEAIDNSAPGSTVLVHPGTYVENINFKGLPITVKSADGPEVTFIDGGSPGSGDYKSVVVFLNNEGPDSILEGFTLVNGVTTGGGGGIQCQYSSPIIRDNIIRDNSAWNGGGIHTYSGTPQIIGNLISDNSVGASGGGIYCIDGENSPLIRDNTLKGNHADSGGGGLACYRCDVELINNLVCLNTTDGNGGGVVLSDCDPVVQNCTIVDNSALIGGGTYVSAAMITISDTIFWGNRASNDGDGMYVNYFYPPEPSTISISYCNFEGGLSSLYIAPECTLDPGPGLMNENPLFVIGPGGDYYLSQDPAQPGVTNPCVDEGSALAVDLGLDGYWTRTDQVPDAGTVDIGFHYGP